MRFGIIVLLGLHGSEWLDYVGEFWIELMQRGDLSLYMGMQEDQKLLYCLDVLAEESRVSRRCRSYLRNKTLCQSVGEDELGADDEDLALVSV